MRWVFLILMIGVPLLASVVPSHRRIVSPTSSSSSTLMVDILAYWKLDETTGDRIDSHGTNLLTANVAPSYTNGVISNAVRTSGPNNSGVRRVDGPVFDRGDSDFTFAGWFKLYLTNGFYYLLSKEGTSQYEYSLTYDNSTDRITWRIWSNCAGSGNRDVVASNFGSPGTNSANFIVMWFDTTNNVVGVSVNDGTPNTTSTTNFPCASTSTFYLCTVSFTGTPSINGYVDEVGYWSRVLTSAERTELYNSGAGKTYPFTP